LRQGLLVIGAKSLRASLLSADDATAGGTLSAAVDTSRPSRAEIEPAALELVRRHGAQIMATARRYAATPEDAEDAYQRGLEILLTKAPTTSADDLVPWLKTVVKHEAFALRKQRERHGVPTEHDDSTPADADTHERVERLDQLQRGAEALQRLKPQETRCLLLLAEGYSYKQICEITGFSYTKVNRCVAEGRLSFAKRFDGIEAGAECARLAPVVSAAADGEAGAEDMLALRRHMRGCLACRASLREARAVPARVAALAPVPFVLATPGDAVAPDGLHAAWNWLHERCAALALRGQEVFEMAAAHKTVAVAASAAALAGGGAATMQVAKPDAPDPKPRRAAAVAAPAKATPPAQPRQATPSPPPERKQRTVRKQAPPAPAPAPPTAEPPPQPTAPEPTQTVAKEPEPPAPARPAPSGSTDGEFGL
jgi:RNA polymerase sigma factor (sigma-70 family)